VSSLAGLASRPASLLGSGEALRVKSRGRDEIVEEASEWEEGSGVG
jgi:hypothetical protein